MRPARALLRHEYAPCARPAQARVLVASWIASTTAPGVDTGAKHIVPAQTTARLSPEGSITAYGCADTAARASSGFEVVTLIERCARSSARAKTAAIRPYDRGRAATDSRARRARSR